MSWHEFLDDDLRDLASLYVVGALEDGEARRFRLHLRTCDACRSEVDSLARTAQSLTLAAPEVALPAGLWGRVLERIRAPAAGAPLPDPRGVPDPKGAPRPNQVWKTWDPADAPAPAGMSYEAAAGAGFEPTGIAGIEVRRLAVDRERERVTMLVRMAAGTTYPAHRHGGAEECFVLEGDLRVGDLHMRGGDFQRAERGTVHPAQTTDEGCVLLIVSSTADELLT